MLALLVALLAAACPLPPARGLPGTPSNASASAWAGVPGGAGGAGGAAEPPCNISVRRPMLSSLLVRWGLPRALPCDLLLFSTSAHGRALFAAAFHRVGSPLLIEHLALAAGAPQDLRLCVGCGWGRARRASASASASASGQSSALPAYPAAAAAAAAEPPEPPGPPWLQAEPLHFCCLDFSLEELQGEPGWRLNRKPIESTLVACFMTLVIVVWSVAALIWPVPIIAGFLPNGMEQRRTAAPAAGTPGTAAGTSGGAAPE